MTGRGGVVKPNRRPTLPRAVKGKLLEEHRARSLNDVGVEVVGGEIDVTSKASLLDEESDMSLEDYEKHLGRRGSENSESDSLAKFRGQVKSDIFCAEERNNAGGEMSACEVVQKGLASVQKYMEGISDRVSETLVRDGVNPDVARSCLKLTRKYEALVMALVEKNGRLETEVKLRGNLVNRGNASIVGMAPPATVTYAGVASAAVKIPKVHETWSAQVQSLNAADKPEEVVAKVLKEVGPSLGVRVDTVRPMKRGGAIIRTPSEAEVKKLTENPKFAEAGLTVNKSPERGCRLSVFGVHAQIAPDQFMSELYDMNLKEIMSPAAFKEVKMMSKPWEASQDEVTVVLEMPDTAADFILQKGKVYVMYFAFRARSSMPHYGCYRCLSFDHRVIDCVYKEQVCKRCGEKGHCGNKCQNEAKCRNCAFKGQPSGHLMMSMSCPVYALRVARDRSRH